MNTLQPGSLGLYGTVLECVGPDLHQGGVPVPLEHVRDDVPDFVFSQYPRLPSTKIPLTFGGPYLLPGEILYDPVIYGTVYGLREPDDVTRERVSTLLTERYRWAQLDNYPEIMRLLDLYANRNPDSTFAAPEEQHDFHWHHRWRHLRWGTPATPPSVDLATGLPHWYYGVIPWSSTGPTHHYHTTLWLAMAYLQAEDDQVRADTWGAGLALAIGDACYGMHRNGDHAGLFRDEGGTSAIGESKLGWWAKQTHFDGLVTWWLLSGHPLLRRAVYEHIAALRDRPLTDWPGFGERIPGWYLHNAKIAFDLTGDQQIAANAMAMRRQVLTDLGRSPLWADKMGAHSPWMVAKLIRACREWKRAQWLDEAEDALWDLVDLRKDRPVPYRHAPIDWSESHWGTHPALVSMAMTRGSRREDLLDHVNAQLAQHRAAGKQPVFGAGWMGSGGLKVFPMILTGALL